MFLTKAASAALLSILLLQATHAVAAPGDIHTYTASDAGFLVNSYLVESDQGVVVIDTQFLLSEARKLNAALERLHKPLVGVIITHPHPDHYNGAGVLRSSYPAVPIYATAKTVAGIRESEAGKRAYWKKSYKEDYPDQTIFPDHEVAAGQDVVIDGLSFRIEDVGAGEALNNSVVYLASQKALFVGDLVYPGMHPWLAEGRSQAWLEQLAALEKRYPQVKTFYPGHGEQTTSAGLRDQRGYLEKMRKLVKEALKSGPLDASKKTTIHQAIEMAYPHRPLAMLIDMNIDGVAQELQSAAK